MSNTRGTPGGDVIRGIDALRRAEQWFLGYHTGHWPPDSVESELEAHFQHVTDVLLGDTFYSETLTGCGRFFAVRDFRRIVEARFEGVSPFIVTALIEEGPVCKYLDARRDLGAVYPWIQKDHWDPAKVVEVYRNGAEADTPVEQGFWWALPREPRPFHDGAGLLRELEPLAGGDAWPLVSGLLGAELTTSGRHLIALRYPARRGGFEWLVLVLLKRPPKTGALLLKSDAEKRREFSRARVFGIRVHSVRPAALALRNTGVIANEIREKTVALIGLGALGSPVAELLAKAGVGRFRLCDGDTLATGNVARHVGGLSQFGAPKVDVVMARLHEINPYLRFGESDIIRGSAVASLERLTEFIAPADLVIVTTADEGVESVVNQVAVVRRKVVLYGRALRRGSMGRAFLVRPGRDPCKACLAAYARAGQSGGMAPSGWIDVTEDEGDAILHECGRPVIPASAVDISFVATLVARVALGVLEGKEAETNHWLWSRVPAPDVDARFSEPFTTVTAALRPREQCPACQEPQVRQVILARGVREYIISTTVASPNAETGGILIGHVDQQGRAVVLRATGPGPQADRSASLFVRDVEYVQGELERAARDFGAQGLYVGEWHSHLEANPRPSPLDVESLVGIAQAPNYATRCPAMIIAGLDPNTKAVAAVRSWVFPFGGRVYEVPNQSQTTEV